MTQKPTKYTTTQKKPAELVETKPQTVEKCSFTQADVSVGQVKKSFKQYLMAVGSFKQQFYYKKKTIEMDHPAHVSAAVTASGLFIYLFVCVCAQSHPNAVILSASKETNMSDMAHCWRPTFICKLIGCQIF